MSPASSDAPSPRAKVLMVSSVGGHLAELLELRPAFAEHELVWVLNDRSPVLPPGERVHVITHAERDLRQLLNLVELHRIFMAERPDLVVSMGASPAVPAALLAKLRGLPMIYVEPSSAVRNLTLTGRLLRHLVTRFYVQSPRLAQAHPGALYAGSLL